MTHPPFVQTLLISIALGFDAFSIALAAGAHGFQLRRMFRLGWHFGLFQFLMPIIGWLAGKAVVDLIGSIGHWIVFLLLFMIGGKMLWEGIKGAPENLPDLSRGWNLTVMALSTSIDALVVGLGFGILKYDIIQPAAIIGIICALMTSIGLYLGVKLYRKLQYRAIIVGGMILIGIGIEQLF
jgi:putative Mn2+ efflux pump MntP